MKKPRLAALVPAPLRRLIKRCLAPLGIEIHAPAPDWPSLKRRLNYQVRYVAFDIAENARVLDVGSGGESFPYATVLTDRFVEPSRHRYGPLDRSGKPLVIADIEHLPFADGAFDFVYCSHLLEHVDNPVAACSELMRVGARGFIETPTQAKDALFAWAKGMHRWHVVAIGARLCFFEYSERQLTGIGSSAWRDVIFGAWYHPLQEAYEHNQDLLNVLFLWQEKFIVHVFRLDGSLETLD